MEHTLVIQSLKKVSVRCSCGQWSYSRKASDAETEDQLRRKIVGAFRLHLKNVGVSRSLKVEKRKARQLREQARKITFCLQDFQRVLEEERPQYEYADGILAQQIVRLCSALGIAASEGERLFKLADSYLVDSRMAV